MRQTSFDSIQAIQPNNKGEKYSFSFPPRRLVVYAPLQQVRARVGGGGQEGQETGLLPRAHALRTSHRKHLVQSHVRDRHLPALLCHVAGYVCAFGKMRRWFPTGRAAWSAVAGPSVVFRRCFPFCPVACSLMLRKYRWCKGENFTQSMSPG